MGRPPLEQERLCGGINIRGCGQRSAEICGRLNVSVMMATRAQRPDSAHRIKNIDAPIQQMGGGRRPAPATGRVRPAGGEVEGAPEEGAGATSRRRRAHARTPRRPRHQGPAHRTERPCLRAARSSSRATRRARRRRRQTARPDHRARWRGQEARGARQRAPRSFAWTRRPCHRRSGRSFGTIAGNADADLASAPRHPGRSTSTRRRASASSTASTTSPTSSGLAPEKVSSPGAPELKVEHGVRGVRADERHGHALGPELGSLGGKPRTRTRGDVGGETGQASPASRRR